MNSPRRVPLEAQVATLAKCGIGFAPGYGLPSVLESFGRDDFESTPYTLLLSAMGSEFEGERPQGAGAYLSNEIWWFDSECVQGPGSYLAMVDRLVLLAGPELPVEDVAESINGNGDIESLSFFLDGVRHRWAVRVDDDWVDPTVLSRFAAALTGRWGSTRRFTYIDLGGQDCLIGCATSVQRTMLANLTGLQVRWLV